MYRLVNLREPEQDLSSSTYWALTETNADLRLKNLRDARAYSESLFELREQYLKELHSLIGNDKLKKYLELHNKRLKEMKRARKELPPTDKGLEMLHKLRQRAVKKSKELIDSSDVDVKVFQKLQRKYAKKAVVLNRKTISKGKSPSPAVRDQGYKKNTTYRPPYLGEDSEHFSDRSRGTATCATWTDQLTGEVGAETGIRITSADDSDFAFAACSPRMRIVHTIETPGLLTIHVELQTINDQVRGSYEDECGYSAYDFHQRLWVYAQRTWPASSMRSYTELPGGSYIHHDRIGLMGMLSWIADYSEPGDVCIATLEINTSPDARTGDTMGIDVGFEALNYCWVNDVTMSGWMRNNYLIREIRVLS